MKKTMLLAAMLAMAVLMMAAAPAMAGDRDGGVSQNNEQEADSGDVDQSFDVSGAGDNSNQTAGLQGVANTGNAQNQISFTDFGNDFDRDDFDGDDFDGDRFDRFFFDRFDGNGGELEFEEVGSSIEVSPTNTTSSDQEVNQAASAFGK